jgi:hypothetical protein
MTWTYALLAILAQDPAPQDLKKEVEQLRKQVEQLEQQAVDDARTIHRLRSALKSLEEGAAPGRPAATGPAKPGPDEKAPVQAIKGRILFVDAANGFVAISVGKPDKVEPGYKFEIFRETFESGSDAPTQTRLGLGEVEKFLGTGSNAKLKVVEGDIKEMKLDDIVVAIRRLAPVAPAPAPAVDSVRGAYRITGRAGTGYMIDYGQAQGAQQTAIVFAIKEGVVKAKLRLDRVDKTYSVANIVAGSQLPGVPPPEQGDEITLTEPNKQLSGKVAYLDSKTQLVAVDLRQHDGVKTGQRFGVYRLGKQVGTVEITDIHPWGSWAKLDAETKHEDIQRGDIIRILEEKK